MDPVRSALDPLRRPFIGPNTVGASWSFWAGFVALVVLAVAYPLFAGQYPAYQDAQFIAYAFLGVSLALVWGYGGILSFGQVAFFGAAGYAFGVITINFASPLGITVGVVASVAIGALLAALLGYFMFYGGVTEVYVTIITLVTSLVLHTFMAQTAGDEWTIGSAALGGFNGMPDIPAFELGAGPVAVAITNARYYWFVLALFVVTFLGLRWLVNSDFGRVAVAVREDEDRTRMFGYDVRRVKLLVFTLGGALAGLGGVLNTAWGSYVSPDVFSLSFAALPVVWVSVGGRKSLIGATVGTLAVAWGNRWLSINLPDFALIAIGTLLVVTILFFPDGVVPRVADGWPRIVAGVRSLPGRIRRLPSTVRRMPQLVRDKLGSTPLRADGDGEVTDR
ncbi:ABC transporter permease subunit [Halococcoides cellulosivorans]|uniref:ABC transporter permease subunit n=1 Tax=Halococcoides cellulosivorans TaxID=1679096 RepID=UPI001574010D